jgi:hypothetical protein
VHTASFSGLVWALHHHPRLDGKWRAPTGGLGPTELKWKGRGKKNPSYINSGIWQFLGEERAETSIRPHTNSLQAHPLIY